MITGANAVIRTAEPDDGAFLKAFYDPEVPRSCLLDQRRELIVPTLDEIREVLARKEQGRSVFYAVEDLEGHVRGFCSLRGLNQEAGYSEFIVILVDDADFARPLATEIFEFLTRRAFYDMRLNKVMTHALGCEAAYRAYLLQHGFKSDGVQREAVFACGRWHDLEAFTLFGRDVASLALEAACP